MFPTAIVFMSITIFFLRLPSTCSFHPDVEAFSATQNNFEAPLIFMRDARVDVFSSGYYFMTLSVGSPVQTFSGLLDTASDLTRLACEAAPWCRAYGYDFCSSGSTTFNQVRCSSEGACPAGTICRKGSCQYNLSRFMGDDFSGGELFSESLTLHMFDEEGRPKEISVDNLLLGCSSRSNDNCHSGVVGLGRGPYSFFSQLGGLFQKRFAYYLRQIPPPYQAEVLGAGTVYFGADDDHHSPLYTPLDTPPNHRTTCKLYTISFTGISVANKSIALPPQTHAILDTGTRPMLLPFVTFLDVAEAVSRAVAFPYFTNASVASKSPGKCVALCFAVGSASLDIDHFPTFVLHFENADLHIPLSNAYLQWNSSTICLAMLGCRPEVPTVIGNHAQQNFKVLYDLEQKQVGFLRMI